MQRSARLFVVEGDGVDQMVVLELESADLDGLFLGEGLRRLEEEVLPRFLLGQRWFAGKSRELRSVRVIDVAWPGTHLMAIAVLEVSYGDGSSERYQIPLTVPDAAEVGSAGDAGPDTLCLIVLAGEVRRLEAMVDARLACLLLKIIMESRRIQSRTGFIWGRPTTSLAGCCLAPDSIEARPSRAEQSHSIVVFPEEALLKVYRKLEAGRNPEVEIGRFLTEESLFRNFPSLLGEIEHCPEGGGEPVTLAILQAWVPNQGTGWDHAREVLRSEVERILVGPERSPPALLPSADLIDRVSESPPQEVTSHLGAYLPHAAMLGRRTAELHLALAARGDLDEFKPQPITSEDLVIWSVGVRQQVEKSLGLLRSAVPGLPEASRVLAREVLEAEGGLLRRLGELAAVEPSGMKLRIHGDFHLGQVLRQGEDFVILDFEGEPLRPLSWRRKPHTAWRDVVGMVRSFDYAASSIVEELVAKDEQAAQRAAPWLAAWGGWMSAAFLRCYLEAAGTAEVLQAESRTRDKIFRAILLEKAAYELEYELAHRPGWVAIPLRGIHSLVPKTESDQVEDAENQ